MGQSGYAITAMPFEDWQSYKQLRLLMAHEEQPLYPSSYAHDCALSDTSWQRRIARGAYLSGDPLLFARNHHGYIGMVGALFVSPLIAEIVSLYVIPHERRKGVASQLMEAIIELVSVRPGCAKLQLHVHTAAAPACALYERLGFQKKGRTCITDPTGIIYEQFLMERYLLG